MPGHGVGHVDPADKKIALLIAIVLASAKIITGAAAPVRIAGSLGAVAVVLAAIGFLAPMSVHLFRASPRSLPGPRVFPGHRRRGQAGTEEIASP